MNKDISFLKSIVLAYSPYGQESKVAKIILKKLKSIGFIAKIDKAGNVIGEKGKGKEIMFIGHMDVYQGIIPVKIEKGNLWGRGSVDAKGSIAYFIAACSKLPKGFFDNHKIIIACCVEEEGPSSKGARYLMRNTKYKPEYIFIGEPSGWENVTIGYKGVLSFTTKFEQNNFHYGSEGFRVTDMAVRFCKDLIDKINNKNGQNKFNKLSLEIRNINSTNNGIKETCQIQVVIRIPPKLNVNKLKQWIKNKADNKFTKIIFTQNDPAVVSNINSKLVKSLRRAIKKFGGKASLVYKLGTSDMNIIKPHYKVPTIAYGPGNSRLDHTPNEHLSLDEFEKTMLILQKSLMSL